MGTQLILAVQTPVPAPTNTFTWTNAATIIAGIGAALIAALVAVIGYSRRSSPSMSRATLASVTWL